MRTMVCPICNKAIVKIPRTCPQCSVSYHPNCWNQTKFCTTCGMKNPDHTESVLGPVKSTEAVTIACPESVTSFSSWLTLPGFVLFTTGLGMYALRQASPTYLSISLAGIMLAVLGALVHYTGNSVHQVSPSTGYIFRKSSLLGFTRQSWILRFDSIEAIRIEGELRFSGSKKGIPTYFLKAYWISALTKDRRLVKLSNAYISEKELSYEEGDNFGGLLPLARRAAATIGVGIYVSPLLKKAGIWHKLATAIMLLALTALIVLTM